MCSTGGEGDDRSLCDTHGSVVTDFSLCELAGEAQSLIRALHPHRNLRHYLQESPCPDFDTNRTSAADWLRKLSDRLKSEKKIIAIKASYVLAPSIEASRTLAPLRSMRDGTGFLGSCPNCGTVTLQSQHRVCPACKHTVDSSHRPVNGKVGMYTLFIHACSLQRCA